MPRLQPTPVGRNRLVLFLPTVALVLVLLLWNPAAGGDFRPGETVVFQGVVTDARGAPIPRIRVVLEASRHSFSLSRFRQEEKGLARSATLTDNSGAYRFEWEWHDFYNTFRLLVVAGSGRAAPGERLKTVERVPVDRKLLEVSPIDVGMTVSDSTFVEEHRRFVGSLEGADQTRIYERMGKPDRVQRMRRGSSEEISWFYFESGRAFRFLDSALTHSEDFTPVKPF